MEGFRGAEREGGGGRSRQARAKGEAGRDRRGRRQATAKGFCSSQRAVQAEAEAGDSGGILRLAGWQSLFAGGCIGRLHVADRSASGGGGVHSSTPWRTYASDNG